LFNNIYLLRKTIPICFAKKALVLQFTQTINTFCTSQLNTINTINTINKGIDP